MHKYVDGAGQRRKYEWVSEEACTTCNANGDREEGYYAVLKNMTQSNTLIVECMNCGHTESRHKATFEFWHPKPEPTAADPATPPTPPTPPTETP